MRNRDTTLPQQPGCTQPPQCILAKDGHVHRTIRAALHNQRGFLLWAQDAPNTTERIEGFVGSIRSIARPYKKPPLQQFSLNCVVVG